MQIALTISPYISEVTKVSHLLVTGSLMGSSMEPLVMTSLVLLLTQLRPHLQNLGAVQTGADMIWFMHTYFLLQEGSIFAEILYNYYHCFYYRLSFFNRSISALTGSRGSLSSKLTSSKLEN